MSFLNTLASGMKTAATFVAQKTQETIDNLKSPPTEIDCAYCTQLVMVAPAVFNWRCVCTTINAKASEKCTTCGVVKPGNLPRPQIVCTMCNKVNEVPWTTAEVQATRAARGTKKALEVAAVKAKETYDEMKSVPVFFNCEHCGGQLANPNNPPVVAASTTVPTTAPPAYTPNPPVHLSVALPQVTQVRAPTPTTPRGEVTHVMCTLCRKETAVPGSNFANSFKTTTQKITKGATQAYFVVSDQRYANCPICSSPVKLPPQFQPKPQASPAPAAGPAPPVVAPAPAAGPVRIGLICEKCGTSFPTIA